MEESNVVSSQVTGENHASIDIEVEIQSIHWAASIKRKLYERSNLSLGPTSYIYRVHERIRQMNKDAYTPDLVSIGPYHRFRQNLKAMEDHKLQYVRAMLDRKRERSSLEKYVEALRKLEAEARRCYSEPIDLCPEEFVEMMLFDGFFIIELLRIHSNVVIPAANDPIFDSSSRRARVVHDLALLENQIPMSVLQMLFDMSKDPNPDSPPLIKMALFFFQVLIPQALHKYLQDNNNIPPNHLHLLDLLSYTLNSSPPTVTMPSLINTSLESLPCVMELRLAGVKFKKSLKYGSLIDIKFRKGVFEIPTLCIDDYTDSFFRNLIAYEQYRFGGRPYITSYAMLMDYLINSADDVAFLRGRGIIMNHLGDDNKVSSLFSSLCNEVSIDNFHYSGLCKDVNENYNRSYNKWKAMLKHNYCNSPWTIISVVVAIVLLLLAISGIVFTSLNFFKVHA